MIYSLWLCFLKKHIKSYSQGISILMLILNIFDLVKGSDIDSIFNSQGTQFKIIKKRNVQSSFCNENLENLFNYTSVKQESSSQLSSNHKPSNQNSSSSTTTALLPQGNKFAEPHFTISPFFPPINRIDSDIKENIPPIAGCIDLNNYNWKYDEKSHNDAARLSDVQIFLFHLNSSSTDRSIDINLRILLYSSQEPALNRPVVIVLSSFLPRKFYLSAISFLFHSHQPLHLILTHPKSKVVIKDELLTNVDLDNLDRLFISFTDLFKDRVFLHQNTEKEFIAQVEKQFKTTSIYQSGYFDGVDYNFLSKSETTKKIWLFNNKVQYSQYKPNMKIVAIYHFNKNGNFIDLILGKSILIKNSSESHTAGCQPGNALTDVINNYQIFEFNINIDNTCFYGINSSPSKTTIKYQTITWLHIKSVTNMSLDIEFISSHHTIDDNGNKTYLVIITGNIITNSLIKLSSLYPKNVQVLTNISLNQFDHSDWPNSLLSLRFIDDLSKGSFQDRTIATYISIGSFAVMQTTIYQFKSSLKSVYRIRINVDDTNSIPQSNIIDVSCSSYSRNNISISLSINLKNWKKFNKWTPTEFQFGNGSCIFQKKKKGILEITQCPVTYENRKYVHQIYGVWKNKKYLLNIEIKLSCKKNNPSKTKNIITTTRSSSDDLIPIVRDGFVISNRSDFKYTLVEPLDDKMVIYVLITNNINGPIALSNTIQLRDCYITNRRAVAKDFKSPYQKGKAFKKITLVQEGCLDNSSRLYSHIHETLRPSNHLMSENLFNSYGLYKFHFVVDADNWAKELSLENQWRYDGQIEVHLYCGISKCRKDQKLDSSIPQCRSQVKQCSTDKLATEQLMKYHGVLRIVKKYENVTLKISLLIIFTVVIILFMCVIFWCLQSFRHNRHNQLQSMNKFYELGKTIDPEASFSNPRKKLVNPDYHSLTLLDNHDKKSSVKVYSEPKVIMSLKRLVESCDKSIFLNAGYLNSTGINQTQSCTVVAQRVSVGKKLRIHSHSASEISLTESTLSNWDINSWPLSTAELKVKYEAWKKPYPNNNCPSSNANQCKSPEPNNSSWQQNTNSTGSSSKQKISYTFNSELKSVSNPKASSNRTTVSESISANDMPAKSTSKWWSLLTNYWINQNFVMTRN